MSFLIFDLAFLVLFTLLVVLFLYSRRKNLQRQGLLYLYRTKVGIKLINWFSKAFSPILKPLQYIVVASGYTLMGFMIWFLVKFSYFYLSSPIAARALKVPVLVPLIPYLPTLFKIDFLPPFYFTYWIIIIAIIAIPHEFAHGIFARLSKVKIHATGFGFLGPFLAAFVEPDEKEMEKKSKLSQLSVLAAGTFANILVAIFFALILWLFFISSFTAAGVNFSTYSTSVVNVSEISQISNITVEDSGFLELEANNKNYFTTPLAIQQALDNKLEYVMAYDDSPAFNAKLEGAISEIDSVKIISMDDLTSSLQSHQPGDTVNIKTIIDGETTDYTITLAEREDKAFLGIGVAPVQSTGIMGSILNFVSTIKDPTIYYESSIGKWGTFIYDLLWWMVLISLSVALVNMIPVGIFDGGRFFLLTIWGITGNRKIGEQAFKISTWIILILVALLMFKWLFAFI